MPITPTRLLQLFQRLRKYYYHQFDPLLERTSLSMREIHVLLFLANNPPCDTARDIAALRELSKSQVSQAVDLLAAEGLLLRTPDREDRRIVHLSITPRGEPLARECQRLQVQCGRRLLEGLSPEERTQFLGLMETVLEHGAHLM